ncbi:hypothetical protein GCM10023196_037580 [Actinoallomurus vinaceus]|uniref:Uncharacterized protein n=1 Tax=Actinoallomurus vinaceus TaxID=1080074 RepID=A0ABP8U9L0_9ACTN
MSAITVGQRLAILKALKEAIDAENADTRAEAEEIYRGIRQTTGVKSAEVALPDGTAVATVSIKAGPTTVTVDEAALLEWTERHAPGEVEEVIDSAALTDPEVLAWFRENRPEAVTRRVRPAWRQLKLAEASKNKGDVVDPLTGEARKIAEFVQGKPTGAFALTLVAKNGSANVLDALQSGALSPDLTGVTKLLSSLSPSGPEGA